eukprot:4109297-Amphidinium_carterae.4
MSRSFSSNVWNGKPGCSGRRLGQRRLAQPPWGSQDNTHTVSKEEETEQKHTARSVDQWRGWRQSLFPRLWKAVLAQKRPKTWWDKMSSEEEDDLDHERCRHLMERMQGQLPNVLGLTPPGAMVSLRRETCCT